MSDDAIRYNRERRDLGRFSDDDLAHLVEYFQTTCLEYSESGGKVDGKFGPKGEAALSAWLAREDLPGEDILPGAHPVIEGPSDFARMIVEVAVGELGEGEVRWNNSGPAIAKYRDRPDLATKQMWGEWCAYAAGWCVEEAARRLGKPELAAFRRRFDRDHQRPMPIGGAKALVTAAGRAGRLVADGGRIFEPLLPGDLVSVHRAGSSGLTGPGHVMIIRSIVAGTRCRIVDGNRGPFPSLMKEAVLDLAAPRTRLCQVARL